MSLTNKNSTFYQNCQAIANDIMEAIFENLENLETCSFCGKRKKVYPVVIDKDGGRELWCESCIERG